LNSSSSWSCLALCVSPIQKPYAWQPSAARHVFLSLSCPLHDSEPTIAYALNVQSSPKGQAERNMMNANIDTARTLQSASSTPLAAAPRLTGRPSHQLLRWLLLRRLGGRRSPERLGGRLFRIAHSVARASSWSL